MIILILHGQTTSNARNLLVGRGDPELTELGRRQAVALRSMLAGVAQVWTSPLQRARHTAALAIPHVDATVNDDFIEVDYGTLDGEPLEVISAEQWRSFERDHALTFGGGESLADVDARVHAQLDRLLADELSLLHSREHHLAIVSHVSPIKSAMVWALGVATSTVWRMQLSNGSITTITTRMQTPALLHYNVVPPLE